MRAAALAALAGLAAAGCGRPEAAAGGNTAGAALEQAAVAAGLVVDPASRSILGAWALDTDRACVVPGQGSDSRIGVLIDYGEGQGCAASGTARRSGNDRLDLDFGECRVTARFDGNRIVLPPEVPAACDRFCTGRATLAAMTVERQSESVAEAANLRAPGGRRLCGSQGDEAPPSVRPERSRGS